MNYEFTAIPESEVPRSRIVLLQHILDTYASETNKTVSVWRMFDSADAGFRPHERSTSVLDIMKHQLLSERRFFAEFLGTPEPTASSILPEPGSLEVLTNRLHELARPRLRFMAGQDEAWWLELRPFFDAQRERIWIFWRRVLHTAHHRTQLTLYLRMLNKKVPATYGPTADVTWQGADPTLTVEAAERK